MEKFFDKAEIFAWMPLTGFDRDLPDKGVAQLFERTGFTLHGVCLFIFHSDFIHQHDGMDKVRTLPPDNCSYYASPYNEERARQEWTNHDLRILVSELKKRGVNTYISIMGVSLGNRFHKEWIYQHPELRQFLRGSNESLNVLKRFSDGTYYEDFFADKLCEVMVDYGLTGVHVADCFCPQTNVIANGDFSRDFFEQFLSHTNYPVPEEILSLTGDTREEINIRGDWIWKNCRAEWIEFFGWRWEQFWKKICSRLHAIGRKAFVLGMYCTDPFQTLYAKGVDLRRIVQNAGVDYLMPNMAANGIAVINERPWFYYQWSTMMLLSDAYTDGARKLNMLGVKDAAEEWDMLHHAPTLLERDISFLPSYFRYKNGELKRCIDGFNICLSDGIYKEEWKWLRERFDIAFDQVPEKILAPTLVWSDAAHHSMLRAYIKTRRWTLHKFLYELNWMGVMTGAVVRTENLSSECGDLFVPNFDLLSDEEKRQLAAYRGGAVICTASAEGDFSPEDWGIQPNLCFTDHDTPFRNMAFVYNMKNVDADSVLALLPEDDGSPILEDPENAPESQNTLAQPMPHQKVTVGFMKALAALLRQSLGSLLESTHPVLPMQLKNGAIRLYVLNNKPMYYAKANITMKRKIEKVDNVSKFPLLPVKFSDSGTFSVTTQDYPGENTTFRVIVPQGGVSIVDVYLK